ncbi:hypothetical protein [Micromonospora sp. NPDC093277]|uniref:hypothetical protein n=1 Tax=Micromonospora sp. NPDC093277 TaxID=3364291 RepID=UPI00382EC7C1
MQPDSGPLSPIDALVPFDAVSGIPVFSLMKGVLGAMEAANAAAETADFRRAVLRQMSVSNALGMVGAAIGVVGLGVAIYDLATERRRREHAVRLQMWLQAWQHAFQLEQQRDAERLRQQTLELEAYSKVRPFRELGPLGSLRADIGLKGGTGDADAADPGPAVRLASITLRYGGKPFGVDTPSEPET